MSLLDFLFPPRADELVLRSVSDDEFLALMAPRLVPETRPGTVALLPFHNASVRATIHEAKYHGSGRAFRLLGSVLADYLRDADDIRETRFNLVTRLNLVALVPIPLGKERLKERGFNQAEEVAKRAVQESGIKIEIDLLIRTRETISQISLAREKREENMHGAFGTTRHADPSYIYIVIDDVLTTGATLQSAINALREAGAEHVIPIALAH